MKPAPSRLKLSATRTDAGLSLAAFLVVRGGISEADARVAIVRGGAFLRGKREKDPQAQVRQGDRVEVQLRASQPPAALSRERILHLDEQVLAIDKPAGVTAQEDRAGGDALPELCAALLGSPVFLVHRLDRGTTGVTLLARTQRAHAFLLEEFRERRARKEYRALTALAPRDGVVDLALGPDPRAQGLRRVDPLGDPSRTRFNVLEKLRHGALVACFPETGRTHQIRVHLRELGTPLLGDTRYGGAAQLTREDGARLELLRPLLHARSLELRHPDGGKLAVEAPEPADFADATAWLR